MKIRWTLLLTFSIFMIGSSVVLAHTGTENVTGWWHGLIHPLSGLDHILAMVAVGIWAALIGEKALWLVPTTFVTVMLMGSILAITGVALPFVEFGIVMSVFVLGILVATTVRLPLALIAAIVGLFAIFHGYAHGAEIPTASSVLSYGVGFVLATVLLHLSGIGIGILFQKAVRKEQLVRLAGVAIAAGGAYIAFA